MGERGWSADARASMGWWGPAWRGAARRWKGECGPGAGQSKCPLASHRATPIAGPGCDFAGPPPPISHPPPLISLPPHPSLPLSPSLPAGSFVCLCARARARARALLLPAASDAVCVCVCARARARVCVCVSVYVCVCMCPCVCVCLSCVCLQHPMQGRHLAERQETCPRARTFARACARVYMCATQIQGWRSRGPAYPQGLRNPRPLTHTGEEQSPQASAPTALLLTPSRLSMPWKPPPPPHRGHKVTGHMPPGARLLGPDYPTAAGTSPATTRTHAPRHPRPDLETFKGAREPAPSPNTPAIQKKTS